jgi:hypothetical protein
MMPIPVPADARTVAERVAAVEVLLRDDTWRKRTNRWIAEELGIDHKLVRETRRSLEANGSINGETLLLARDGRRFEARPATNPDAPCRGCGLAPSLGCTCHSKADLTEAPSFAAPADARWWDCPLCGETYSREGAELCGWVKRCFCGLCADSKPDEDDVSA